MNKDTILINVSRGGLINEEALIKNLINGKIDKECLIISNNLAKKFS